MPIESPRFLAWQQAEQHVTAAESALYAKVLAADASQFPSREEVAAVRKLRETANELMKQMLEEMRERAALLKVSRAHPGEPARVNGFGGGDFASEPKS